MKSRHVSNEIDLETKAMAKIMKYINNNYKHGEVLSLKDKEKYFKQVYDAE